MAFRQFDYECPHCGSVTERMVTWEDRDSQHCHTCDGPLNRLPSALPAQFKLYNLSNTHGSR